MSRRVVWLMAEDGDLRIPLQPGPNRVGREPRINEVVLYGGGVSRFHAVVDVAGEAVRVRDLDSKNGTRVNGRRVSRQALAPEDRVVFGRQAFRVRVELVHDPEETVPQPDWEDPEYDREATVLEEEYSRFLQPEVVDAPTEQDPREPELGAGPAGHGEYVVRQGDCVCSIAAEHGHRWQTLWEHPDNAALREARDPNVLLPGDRVHVPLARQKILRRSMERRHRLVRRGEPCRLVIHLRAADGPLAGVPFRLTYGDVGRSGNLDQDGGLEVLVPGGLRRARLEVGAEGGQRELEVFLGSLDPVCEISGIKARLASLGFYTGELDGELDDEARAAIARFQDVVGLQGTGEPDAYTCRALESEHGRRDGAVLGPDAAPARLPVRRTTMGGTGGNAVALPPLTGAGGGGP